MRHNILILIILILSSCNREINSSSNPPVAPEDPTTTPKNCLNLVTTNDATTYKWNNIAKDKFKRNCYLTCIKTKDPKYCFIYCKCGKGDV